MSFFYSDDQDEPRIGRIVAVILLAAFIIPVIVFGVRWVTAPAKGALDAREQIQSGDFRIQAYNHFFDACASIQTSEAAIDSTKIQIKDNTDPTDLNRLQTNLNGQTVARADAVNQYNADARKGYTQGQFRSASLPYQISTDYTPGVHTSCGT